MEPFISKDGQYLFFNNHQGENGKDIADKDLFYAERIDDLTYEYKGEIGGVNTLYVEGNPTMDENNNFYFITTRDYAATGESIYTGVFNDGTVTNLKRVSGSVNTPGASWINMGVEITKTGDEIYTSRAHFTDGNPDLGNIRYAIANGDDYQIHSNEEEILKNINTDTAIEYAGEVSNDGLEIFFSRLTISESRFRLLYSKRSNKQEAFGTPISIPGPFEDNLLNFVEGPALSPDGKKLYYHKLGDNDKFSIFMLTRS